MRNVSVRAASWRVQPFERIAHPTVDTAGCRTPALQFGDPRVMALTGALCHTLLAATGFTNKNLRVLIAGLLGSDYRPGQIRRPTPGTTRTPGRPQDHQPPCRRLRRPCPPHTSSMKLDPIMKNLATKDR
jgi:hypothetical protein